MPCEVIVCNLGLHSAIGCYDDNMLAEIEQEMQIIIMRLQHVYSLSSTLYRYIHWVVFHIGYGWMHCIVYTGCRCMFCMKR